MRKFIRRENVKVLLLTDQSTWNLRYPLLRSAGVRRIVVHDLTSGARTPPTGLKRILKRMIVNLPGVAADIVVAVSDYIAERDRAVTLIEPSRIQRVWSGVDPVPPGSEDGQPDIRTILGVDAGTQVIGCSCRAAPEKGVDVLLRAFDVFARTSTVPAVLAYIGNGPELEKLEDLRRSLGSADRIRLLGYLPRASTILRTANVCVVPSIWEDALPLAVLETMARGRAIIGTRVGGVPEMIEDGVSGVLVPRSDVNALAEALSRVVSSPALQEAYGSAARERSARLFNGDRQTQLFLDKFQDVFAGA
jgi:glycosyltransferase involved in cell wall biosynthesis